MNKTELIKLLKDKDIKKIFDDLWIIHLYLVWSYSRWENKDWSDIDLVYKKSKEKRIWWLEFIKNKHLLEQKLNSKIDLVDEEYVNKHLKPFIERDKIIIY